MRQIIKYVFSAVKAYRTQHNVKLLHSIKKGNVAAYKLLLLIAFCIAGQFVKAQEAVQASFSTFDFEGCVPIKVQFADNSTGQPTAWFWDFGNGQTSVKPDPSVTYTTPGDYTVKLVVRNAVSVDSFFAVIDINGAVADFNYNYTNICTVPATVNFRVPTPRNNVIYRWDFGDTHKAITPVVPNTYESAGLFTVHLTTIGSNGCKDSITKVIQVGSGTADFKAPATVCVNDYITFTDTSTPHAASATWLLNNAAVQQGSSFTHHFTTPGTYSIQLNANFGTCNSSKTRQVQVLSKPTASFSIKGTVNSCTYPDTIHFVNTSANAAAFKWDFGDGTTSAEVSPLHVYKAGRFSPTLIAVNANGCTDTLIKTDAIFLGGAVIYGFNLPDSGCAPHPVTFIANIAAPEAIASYAWNFGDGSTDVVAQPTHTYTALGRYTVSLTLKTVSGCTTTQVVNNAVSVGTHSIPDFKADKTIVCGNENIQFKGTASGTVTDWLWKFDGFTAGFTQNPKYGFTDTGSKVVKLTVNNSGCVDSVVKRNFIVVKPPIASFKLQFDCSDRSKVGFIDNSIDPRTWQWDFGDGTTSAQQKPPVHDYPASDRYVVSLTTTNGGCTSTYSDFVYILNTQPVFSFIPADRQVCRKANIQLGVDNPSYILDYLWDLDDGHTLFSDTSILYSYIKTGIYYPSLIARYHNGCQDTLYSPDSIQVTGPTAGFAAALPAVCLHDTTAFVDNSYSDGEHDIADHVWSYGDGTSESNNTGIYTHVYANNGTYKVSLAIADNNNCFDTAYYNVVVNALPVVSAGMDVVVCEGSTTQLHASGALSYTWNQDPGLSCLSCADPIAAPLDSATYTVTGADINACKSSDSVLVTVVHPLTLVVDKTIREVCAFTNVQLNASGVDSYTWSPADGLNSTAISNPVASPLATTTYYVTGTDYKGCFSQTDSVLVTIHSKPDVIITNNDLEVEKGSSNLINTTGSSDITKWYWYPSLGLSCTNCPQPVVTPDKSITYTAVVYTGFGCTDTALLTVHVLCNNSKIYIPSAFTPNGDGKNERFYVKSSIDNPVRNFMVFNRTGELVFSKPNNSSTNYAADGWDGTYKGRPAPMGTYIFRIEILCNKIVVPFTGTVTLIR